MSQYLDGVSSTASQHGPKQISLPLQADGNYHATLVRRNYIAAPASAYEPIIGQRTAYTSLLRYSDDFSQANWVKVNTTAAVTSTINDPEGGVTASKLAEDTTNGAHNASQVCACAAGATAFGVFVKAAERTFVRLRLYNATDGSLGNAVFNLSTGVLVSGTGTIKKLLYGWYWCAIAQTAAVTNSTLFVDLGSDATTWSYAGTTGSGVYVWRATAYLAASIGPAIATTSTTPTAVTCPPIDADDPTAFLVSEQEPSGGALEIGIGTWSRQYANIPQPVIVPGSLIWTTPEVPGSGTTRLYGVTNGANCGMFYQADTTQNRFEVYSRKSIAVDQGVSNAPTGGTYVMQFGAVTTGSLNYATTAGSLKTALDALSSVTAAGGISTITGNYNDALGFLVTLNSLATGSIDTSSLTTSGPGTVYFSGGSNENGWAQYLFALMSGAGTINGGTFTVTLFGQTTAAIAYNATSATILAAINALSEVTARGGVSWGYTSYYTPGLASDLRSIKIPIGFSGFLATGISSLTPTPSSVNVTVYEQIPYGGCEKQYIKLVASQGTRLLTFTLPHGLVASDAIYVLQGSTYYYKRTDWTYVSSNQITVDPAIAPWSTGTAITYAGKYQGQYTPGPRGFNTIDTTRFWMAGWSPGIVTLENLPEQEDPISDANYLDAIVQGLVTIPYSENDLQTWLGNIVRRTLKELYCKLTKI